MDEMKLPRFQMSDLEKGSMKFVLECLLTLRAQYMPHSGRHNLPKPSSLNKCRSDVSTTWQLLGPCFRGSDCSRGGVSPQVDSPTLSGEDSWKGASRSKFHRCMSSPVVAEASAALKHHARHEFHEVFQLKQGCYADLPDEKISEMMKSNSLDNAPTQSLLNLVNGILYESVESNNWKIPPRMAGLLRKVMQAIERRISAQAEHLRNQNNLFKSREKKYQSRIKVLEALAIGSSEEPNIFEYNHKSDCQQEFHSHCWWPAFSFKRSSDSIKMEEEKKKHEEQDIIRLVKENDQINREKLALKQELELARKAYEDCCVKMETKAKGAEQELEVRLKDVMHLLTESRKRVNELEAYSESKNLHWKKKEHIYQRFTEFQLGALQELRLASQSIKQDILETQKSYLDEFHRLEKSYKTLVDASENYYAVVAENRKLHNEVQELKGNIRVYCRIRPFLPGQMGKESTIEHIGENGELNVLNSSKQGKDGHQLFKFNKVYGPDTTQAEVYSDIQPLIRSVLDGYNACIFAYGQTGSGKTYTMTGPDGASEEEWGVNYRALNDLFHISQTRRKIFAYEIELQMVEIYNEQVRDLLSSDGSQKKLGILSTSQPNGLAVPDASLHPVKSTSDVVDLIELGLRNRAMAATALNERSSRSHSVVTIHVHGIDMKTSTSLRGSLHLVDLAGSERVDRSEVTGDRLKEAQHINKSLAALGDVIFALSQKSPHIPYRNSKLTQVLQNSLGGHAKTLMFVQLNPDLHSYAETTSTLKFAERVSGVELGAAQSNKQNGEIKDLMEQVASLKDIIAKKDEEIERLQLLKEPKSVHQHVNSEKHVYGSSSPRKNFIGGIPPQTLKLSGGNGSGLTEAASDHHNCLDYSDKDSELSPRQSFDMFKHQKEPVRQSKPARGNRGRNISVDSEILGFGDTENKDTLSGISCSGLSAGPDIDRLAESNHSSKGVKPLENTDKVKFAQRTPRAPPRPHKSSASLKKSASGSSLSGLSKSSSGSNLSTKASKRWQ
ncbi:kinesin-like protein KIN-14C isoform X3 [Camellia sinensis]|nr:kinesin-like protein KIN-14C isoform X3 [Camellia sinensis]